MAFAKMGPVSRFVKYRGEWIAMQANIDTADARTDHEDGPLAEASVYVPNMVAAAAPALLKHATALLDAVDQCRDTLRGFPLLPDWACAECRPDSDILCAGFQCGYHGLKAAIRAARGES